MPMSLYPLASEYVPDSVTGPVPLPLEGGSPDVAGGALTEAWFQLALFQPELALESFPFKS